MKKNKSASLSSILCLVLSVVLSSGCALGPLVSHETARTVGASNHELVGGFGQAGYLFKWNYGLSENLDLGFHYESLSFGFRAKYAFINNKDGFSLASALGAGSSFGGDHYYADLIGSYLTGSFEPYGTLRYVSVKTDPLEFRNKDTGAVDFTINSASYSYGQFMLGGRYWITPNWILSAEMTTLFSVSSAVTFSSQPIFGGAIGYRF